MTTSILKIVKSDPLFFAFLFPALVDGAITLYGQDANYWTNKSVNEASPAYYFLLTSPWFFVIGSLVWFTLWYWIFKKLREPFNLFLMFLFIAGHSWGSTAWIWKLMKLNGIFTPDNQISVMFAWGIVVAYFALIAFFAAYCLSTYIRGLKHK